MKYEAEPIKTRYWHPGDNYITIIIDAVKNRLNDGDIVTISEKALSVAQGNIIDESQIKPSLLAKVLARYWKRYVWGYLLGALCHLKPIMVHRFRKYPVKEGAAHKQLALERVGFLHALKYGSEGGIDVSNVPYAYACLPLPNPQKVAEEILEKVKDETGKKVGILIVDTDETYSWCGLHLASRPTAIRGIHSAGGFLPHVLGRALKLKQRATPLAIAGCKLTVEEALEIAEIAHHTRRYGAGRTVWDMAERFHVGLTEVTWKMLESIEHRPIAIVKRRSST